MESSEDRMVSASSASASGSTKGDEGQVQVQENKTQHEQQQDQAGKGIKRVKSKLSASGDPDLEKRGTFMNPLVGHIEHRVTIVNPSVVGIEVEVKNFGGEEDAIEEQGEEEKNVIKETRNSLIENDDNHDEEEDSSNTAQAGTAPLDLEQEQKGDRGSAHIEKSNAKETRNALIDEEEKETHSVFSVNPLNPGEVELTPIVPRQNKSANTSLVLTDDGGNLHQDLLPLAVHKTQSGKLVNPLFEPCYKKYKFLSYLPALEVHEMGAGVLMLTFIIFIIVTSEYASSMPSMWRGG